MGVLLMMGVPIRCNESRKILLFFTSSLHLPYRNERLSTPTICLVEVRVGRDKGQG